MFFVQIFSAKKNRRGGTPFRHTPRVLLRKASPYLHKGQINSHQTSRTKFKKGTP